MSDFVLLFRINDADQRAALGTPEQAQRSMELWLAWIRDLEAGGHLKSRGEPLEREKPGWSNSSTRRSAAMGSSSAGSQSSIVPRKRFSSSRGTPRAGPMSR